MNRVILFFLAVLMYPNVFFTSDSSQSNLNFKIQQGLGDVSSDNKDNEKLQTEVELIADSFVAVEGSEDDMLQAGFIPGAEVRIKLISFENNTDSSEFKIFYGAGFSRGMSFPGTTLTFPGTLPLIQNTSVNIQCSKGSYLPIYVKDEGQASGNLENGFEGPYCLSMWLGYPQVNEQEKVYVSYAVSAGKKGHIGIKIGDKGQCQIVALQDVKIL